MPSTPWHIAGVSPSALFWGKAAALAVELAVLQAVLLVLAVVLYNAEIVPSGVFLLLVTWLVTTVALATVGTLYGGLAAGARGRRPCSRCSCSQWWRRF